MLQLQLYHLPPKFDKLPYFPYDGGSPACSPVVTQARARTLTNASSLLFDLGEAIGGPTYGSSVPVSRQ